MGKVLVLYHSASGNTAAMAALVAEWAGLIPGTEVRLREVDAAQSQRVQILNTYLSELFIRTRRRRPLYLLLDIDPSDDPTHGQQEGSAYHGYYRQHMLHPLLIFDGQSHHLITAVLRPGNAHGSTGVKAVLKRVVRAIRGRELFVFTPMETKDWLDERHQRIRDAYDECARWESERATDKETP